MIFCRFVAKCSLFMMKNVGVVVRKNLEMIFEGFPRSELVEKDIRDRVARLEENSDKIITWRVHLELKHDGQHQGRTFHVRISAHIRGRDLVVSQIRHDKHAHEDLKVAIRDAFASMSRQLEGEQGTVRANVKAHELPLHGVVEKMDYIEGHGFIRTSDDRRIYFNLNSVLDNMFYSLEPGSEVRFVEHEGDLGSQASRVYVLGTHHEVG